MGYLQVRLLLRLLQYLDTVEPDFLGGQPVIKGSFARSQLYLSTYTLFH